MRPRDRFPVQDDELRRVGYWRAGNAPRQETNCAGVIVSFPARVHASQGTDWGRVAGEN